MLWRRNDIPGHEYCDVIAHGLRGVALFAHDGQPCRLDYEIECDSKWVTRSAIVKGNVGDREIDIRVTCENGAWTLNGAPCPEVGGCIDVDLNFSPSTNLLPIRRLNLDIGASARVRAAWLRFPSFALEPLEQTYTRVAARTYRYESAGGRFVATIDVDEDTSLPTNYGDIWSGEL